MSEKYQRTMTDECYRFIVSGQVQGVFFRQSAAGQARQLGLCGWVRNLADGRVEGVVRGESETLARFKAWLRNGPPKARVEDLQWIANDANPVGDFEVRG
jgi:acylphosphatase